jgi:hypothetical protein
MTKLLAEECRKRAVECAEMAEQQEDPEIKREYSDFACLPQEQASCSALF